ncbi:MAG TPA: hypothetical protein VGY53_01770, partial [Isosphaeraceae bacterium]|nr:hypothetical protein [Isosphaeraceae bacterium]
MTYDSNDPRFTAYALGELDQAECAAVEAVLAESPEGRQAVEEIRAAAWLLTLELRKEQGPGLGTEQIEAIEAMLVKPVKPAKNGRSRWPVLALAASLLLGMAAVSVSWLLFLKGKAHERERLVALANEAPVILADAEEAGAAEPTARAPLASSAPVVAARLAETPSAETSDGTSHSYALRTAPAEKSSSLASAAGPAPLGAPAPGPAPASPAAPLSAAGAAEAAPPAEGTRDFAQTKSSSARASSAAGLKPGSNMDSYRRSNANPAKPAINAP